MCLLRALQNTMSASSCVPLSEIKKKTHTVYVFALSNPISYSRILICVPSNLNKKEEEDEGCACVWHERSKISPKTLMCVSLCETKKEKRRHACVRSEHSKMSLREAYVCPFLCPISKFREEQDNVSYMYQNRNISKQAQNTQVSAHGLSLRYHKKSIYRVPCTTQHRHTATYLA